MASGTPMSGTVEAVNAKGWKIDGKWFNKAQKFNGVEPAVGDQVSFAAYGQDQNLVYRFSVGGSNGATNTASNSTGASAGNHHRDTGSNPGHPASSPRATALMAAATLLQGSEGTAQDVASTAIAIAKAFEVYLGSSVTGSTVETDEEMF